MDFGKRGIPLNVDAADFPVTPSIGLVTATDCWSPRWTIMTLPPSFPDMTVPW